MILRYGLLEQCASCLITQGLFHAPLLWKRAAGDRCAEATDTSPCLPHEKSSSFSLTYALFCSCSRADERSCGLGGETSTESEEKRCLKRRKEDFREAMRHFEADGHGSYAPEKVYALPSLNARERIHSS